MRMWSVFSAIKTIFVLTTSYDFVREPIDIFFLKNDAFKIYFIEVLKCFFFAF